LLLSRKRTAYILDCRTQLWLTDRTRFAFTGNRLSAKLSRITMTRTSDINYRIPDDT
ncbi:hypothetical protein T07_941, partial [Trichinella nelsoni]